MSAVSWSTEERLRLAKLQDYCILDTLPDTTYNELAELAAHVCQMPAGLVTFVDTNRLWVKARVGADISETPRYLAFCDQTIRHVDTLVIEDAQQHPEFRNNPLVVGPPYVRFYAGHPLITPDGYALGTLCVLDYQPRRMSPQQINALRMLSHQVVAQMELSRQAHQLQQVNNSLEQRVIERTNSLSTSLHRLLKVQSALLKREATSRHNALHDPLTGLPNRSYFLQRLEQSVQLTQRNSNHQYAVLFIDLDSFKPVNDTLGHEVGDQLLTHVANRIKRLLRKSDLVARLGGDEFAVLLDDIAGKNEAITAVRRIQWHLEQPFTVANRQLSISASIGIALSQLGYQQAESVLRDADTAMYQAKRLAKERSQMEINLQLNHLEEQASSPIVVQETNHNAQQFVVFDSHIKSRTQARLILEDDLRQALIRGQFRLHYQPIFELKTQQLAALEGLLRWNHPRKGWVCANEFIHIAEQIDVVRQLSPSLIDQACQQLVKWGVSADSYAGSDRAYSLQNLTNKERSPHIASDLKLHLNLSASQLRSPQLVPLWQSALEKHQLNGSRFQLEIDESLLLTEETTIAANLKALKALGLNLCIDGFGKGHFSFSRLHQLEVNSLKIDPVFVAQAFDHKDNVDLLKTINDFGRSANITVIGSGIETTQQLELLISLDYQLGQGNWLANALASEHIDKAISK
ncbi:GGDEF domain protein [Synechococcus sp. PCC 7335]|uniref:putative bifunctional diguanylate cyclase/phosphodiesterase n=1 Tax=Synechococcus sp. (strain ATCC 29403 / PCC 7335) TaxID=91464 RepID=UPI00017ED541|nr:EAL domain-containing protein [Synechococcus sp. PCC 7335]EDX85916.1 GGDEF domain protein [Synechococcus sp. PCC 7335]